ncbi:MAG TPA: hypothetical protein VMU85_13825 [Stellaceae bacterium]|nr:hypothetical protein [Stellaceae bacterium]
MARPRLERPGVFRVLELLDRYDEAPRQIAGYREVWQATAGEIAARYLAHGPQYESSPAPDEMEDL